MEIEMNDNIDRVTNSNCKDCLDRSGFLELLDKVVALSIKRNKENADYGVIAIDGEWGSGKSWVLQEFIERHKREYMVFYYNAWSNDFYDEPLVAMLSSIVDSINSSNNFELLKKKVKKPVVEEIKRLLLDIIGGLEFEGIQVRDAINFIKTLKHQSDIVFVDDLKYIGKAIEQVGDVLSNVDVPVILIVDELDRCLPKYSIKVMERLHHLDMRSKMIQVVAINKNAMGYGIAKAYGRYDLLNSANVDLRVARFASDYLTKIFGFFCL